MTEPERPDPEFPWRTVTIEQTGPDGTTAVALLIFYVCPVCAAVVPPSGSGAEDEDTNVFVDQHQAWHRRLRWADVPGQP